MQAGGYFILPEMVCVLSMHFPFLGLSEPVDDPDHQYYENYTDEYGRIKTGFENSFHKLAGAEEE
jgi:hypothetical protein